MVVYGDGYLNVTSGSQTSQIPMPLDSTVSVRILICNISCLSQPCSITFKDQPMLTHQQCRCNALNLPVESLFSDTLISQCAQR
jgi:hypothetical protein